MFSILKDLFLREEVDFQALLARNALLVDVRTPGEFAQGHAQGAVNIPLNSISQHFKEMGQLGKPVLVCCRSGARSGQARRLLLDANIEAYNAGTWQELQAAIARYSTKK